MRFLDRVLRKAGSKDRPTAEAGWLPGRFSDLEEAHRLAREKHWLEALAVVDHLLGIPEDPDVAKGYLRELMKNEAPAGIDPPQMMGRDITGAERIKFRLRMGGGLVSSIMGFRSQCYSGAIAEIAKTHGASSRSPCVVIGGSDPDLSRMARKAFGHVGICMELFKDDPDCLALAAAVCHTLGQFDVAQSLLSRSLELDPGNGYARELMPVTMRRLEEFRDR